MNEQLLASPPRPRGRPLAISGAFRTLHIVIDFTRKCVAIEVDWPLPGLRVACVLYRLHAAIDLPQTIVVDNGPESGRRSNPRRPHYPRRGQKGAGHRRAPTSRRLFFARGARYSNTSLPIRPARRREGRPLALRAVGGIRMDARCIALRLS